MKKILLVLTVLTFAPQTSSAMGRKSAANSNTSTPPPMTLPTPTNIDDVTGGLTVQIRKANYFSATQLAKLNSAREFLEKVLNSEEFKQKVLHHTYNNQETYVQNGGLTNLQIYKKMMMGAESYPVQTEANRTMDFFAELYYSRKNVIGYTNPSTATVFMNSKYFNYFTPAQVAGNMVHEWLHKLGFEHDYDRTARRPFSVPYAVGDMVDELMLKLQ
jgi:hypothetical protein